MALSLSGALEEDPEGVFAHSEGVRLPSWVGNVACADSSWEQVDMGSYLELSIGSHAPAPASLLSPPALLGSARTGLGAASWH